MLWEKYDYVEVAFRVIVKLCMIEQFPISVLEMNVFFMCDSVSCTTHVVLPSWTSGPCDILIYRLTSLSPYFLVITHTLVTLHLPNLEAASCSFQATGLGFRAFYAHTEIAIQVVYTSSEKDTGALLYSILPGWAAWVTDLRRQIGWAQGSEFLPKPRL